MVNIEVIKSFTSNIPITEIADIPRYESAGKLVVTDEKLTFESENSFLLGKPVFSHYSTIGGYRVYTQSQTGFESGLYQYYVDKVLCGEINSLTPDQSSNILGIQDACFSIRGFNSWLGIEGISFVANRAMYVEYSVSQNRIRKIILYKYDGVDISIQFQANCVPLSLTLDGTHVEIENKPVISLHFVNSISYDELIKIMYSVVRFFALLIGCIAFIDDIKIRIDGIDQTFSLYINKDFSFDANTLVYKLLGQPRVAFASIRSRVADMFDKWMLLNSEPNMTYLIDLYFSLYVRRKTSIEDRFLACCKIIEGYDLSTTELEKKASEIEDALAQEFKVKSVKDALSPLLLRNSIKYDPKKIAAWISTGYLNRISLTTRLMKYDKEYYHLLSRCQNLILNDGYSERTIIERIGDTRNYYAHMKIDKKGLLNFREMVVSSDVMLAIIISILLNRIGFDKVAIEKIISSDAKFASFINEPYKT